MFFNKSVNPLSNLLRGILAIIVGIAIVVVPDLSITLVIQIIGGMLLLDGVISFLVSLFNRSKQQNVLMVLPRGTASLVSGTIFIVFPSFIVGFFVFLVGLVLILLGGAQLIGMGGRNGDGFSVLTTIISILALVGGFFMLSNPFKSAVSLLIFFGVVVAIYGIGEIFMSFKIRKYQKQNPPDQLLTIDADYEELK
ncbi:MAG TPA: DUF308 domain-containing protein [Prolixibacteraceae bacterium]|nr:DUF308 domain-containing protein [Prolixibacteraceae bacterium]